MQHPNEHGVYKVETLHELAREGRSYAAVRLAECEDGRFRYALDFQAPTIGFGGPISARDAGFATLAEAKDAGRDAMLQRWPTAWPSEPEATHRALKAMRQQIERARSQPSLF